MQFWISFDVINVPKCVYFGDTKGNMRKLIRNTGSLSTLIKHEFLHVKIFVLT